MAKEVVLSNALMELAAFGETMFEDALYGASNAPNSVSTRGSRFGLIQDGERMALENPLKLHFVTLAVKAPLGRRYYEGAFEGDGGAMADCYSFDSVTPEANAAHPQAETCATCVKSQWGSTTSKLTGAGIPACRSYKDIAIKILGIDGAWLLRIPPASVKSGWARITKEIEDLAARERNQKGKSILNLATCVIEASFVEGKTGILTFRPFGYVPEGELPEVRRLLNDQKSLYQLLWGPEGELRYKQWAGARIGIVAPAVTAKSPVAPPIPPPAPPPIKEEPQKPTKKALSALRKESEAVSFVQATTIANEEKKNGDNNDNGGNGGNGGNGDNGETSNDDELRRIFAAMKLSD